MNSYLRWLVPLLTLAVVGGFTASRLRESAALRRGADSAVAPVTNPYAGIARIEERRAGSTAPAAGRNPFAVATVREVTAPRRTRPVEAPPSPVRETPVLTAIVSDADPRALLRYEGRNYTVKSGDLFAEFRVVSVSAERVILESGTGRIVLRRPLKGD